MTKSTMIASILLVVLHVCVTGGVRRLMNTNHKLETISSKDGLSQPKKALGGDGLALTQGSGGLVQKDAANKELASSLLKRGIASNLTNKILPEINQKVNSGRENIQGIMALTNVNKSPGSESVIKQAVKTGRPLPFVEHFDEPEMKDQPASKSPKDGFRIEAKRVSRSESEGKYMPFGGAWQIELECGVNFGPADKDEFLKQLDRQIKWSFGTKFTDYVREAAEIFFKKPDDLKKAIVWFVDYEDLGEKYGKPIQNKFQYDMQVENGEQLSIFIFKARTSNRSKAPPP
jgi:hypothetical protein